MQTEINSKVYDNIHELVLVCLFQRYFNEAAYSADNKITMIVQKTLKIGWWMP